MSEVAQSCPTLCDPVDCSLPGSSIHGILWARILEWVAISFSRISSWAREARISLIAGRRFTVWATREAWTKTYIKNKSKIKGNFKEILFVHICWEIIKFFNIKEVSTNKFLIEKYLGYKYEINRKTDWWQYVCYFAKFYENKMNNQFFKCHNSKMTLNIIVSVS